MTESIIQKALFINFSSHKYRFTNVYYFENESDFLSFMPNGYCYEIEIKISRQDFKVDFKKIKHDIHSAKEKGSRFYLQKVGDKIETNPSWELCRCYPELIHSEVVSSYRNGEQTYISMKTSSRIEFREFKNKKLPNKFFYAVPTGLISKEEVPDYAGLLYIDENLKVTKVKDAKFIHKDVLTPEKIFNKTYYAYERALQQKFIKMNKP